MNGYYVGVSKGQFKGGLVSMDIIAEVGEAAGEVWRLLESSGPLTVAQVKKKLNRPSELLNFAVGWLAREDKLEIIYEKKNYRLQVK